MFDKMDDTIKTQLVKEICRYIDDPLKNLTTKDIAKDLHIGLNKANEIFRREDFPSINIGKEKKVNNLAYQLWKFDRRVDELRK